MITSIFRGAFSAVAIAIFIFSSNEIIAEGVVQSEEAPRKEPVFVGKFFDQQVPIENYYFIKGVIIIWGSKWGEQPKTPEELEKAVWDQLLLSYEAFRRGVTVDQETLEVEIANILEAEKVDFDWKKDKEAYEKWVKQKVNAPGELFENQIRHLLQIEKLKEIVMDSIEPRVKEEEAYQEFLNEYNTLGVELVEFSVDRDAREFYNKAKKNPKFWDEEKAKTPEKFKSPGSVSLEFLIDIWKFPQGACYKMMEMKIGSIHPPVPSYRGYAVFKILDKRPADNLQYKKLRDSYYEQIKRRKKYEVLGKWFEDLREQAKVEVYPMEPWKEEKGNE